jgi:hypothetical protein
MIRITFATREETLEAFPIFTIFPYPDNTPRPRRSFTTQGISIIVERVDSRSIQKKNEKK